MQTFEEEGGSLLQMDYVVTEEPDAESPKVDSLMKTVFIQTIYYSICNWDLHERCRDRQTDRD